MHTITGQSEQLTIHQQRYQHEGFASTGEHLQAVDSARAGTAAAWAGVTRVSACVMLQAAPFVWAQGGCPEDGAPFRQFRDCASSA